MFEQDDTRCSILSFHRCSFFIVVRLKYCFSQQTSSPVPTPPPKPPRAVAPAPLSSVCPFSALPTTVSRFNFSHFSNHFKPPSSGAERRYVVLRGPMEKRYPRRRGFPLRAWYPVTWVYYSDGTLEEYAKSKKCHDLFNVLNLRDYEVIIRLVRRTSVDPRPARDLMKRKTGRFWTEVLAEP